MICTCGARLAKIGPRQYMCRNRDHAQLWEDTGMGEGWLTMVDRP